MNLMNTKKMNPIVNPEKMLPVVADMLYHQAWKFATRYPITFEEAKSEAYLAFVESCYSYNRKRGSKFTTWCYHEVWCKLKDLITARTTDRHVLVDLSAEDELDRRNAEDMMGASEDLSQEFFESIEDLLQCLSDDAKRMLEMILDTPKRLLDGKRPTPLQLVTRVRRDMIATGTSKDDVDQIQQELQTRFSVALAA